jgi:RNA polymerase sigma-70 factor, ECF subfamily
MRCYGRYRRAVTETGEVALVEALRDGDERAFRSLIERHHASLVRIARLYVGTPAVAEEVAQETWLAVLEGLNRFEGRSSLKTWIFSILTNRAKTRALRERRSIPFSALGDDEPGEPAVEPERFLPADDPRAAGHWVSFPRAFGDLPEERLLAGETVALIERTIERLPPGQRAVISLRDVEGWGPDEVCNALDLSETNQRVLLHRARSAVRAALERYFDEEDR